VQRAWAETLSKPVTAHEQLLARVTKLRAGGTALRDLIALQDDVAQFDAERMAETVEAMRLSQMTQAELETDAGGVVAPMMPPVSAASLRRPDADGEATTWDVLRDILPPTAAGAEAGGQNVPLESTHTREGLTLRLSRAEDAFCEQLRVLEKVYARPVALVLRDRVHGIDPLARVKLDRGMPVTLEELWLPPEEDEALQALLPSAAKKALAHREHEAGAKTARRGKATTGRLTTAASLSSSRPRSRTEPGQTRGRERRGPLPRPKVTVVREDQAAAQELLARERRLMSLSDFVAVFWDTLALAEVHEACAEDLAEVAAAVRVRAKVMQDGPAGAELTVGVVMQTMAQTLASAFRDWLCNINAGMERLHHCLAQSALLRSLLSRVRQDTVSSHHSVQSLLLMPLTRPAYYVSMVEDMLRLTPDHHADRPRLAEALVVFRELAAEARRARAQFFTKTEGDIDVARMSVIAGLDLPRLSLELGAPRSFGLQVVRRLTLYAATTLSDDAASGWGEGDVGEEDDEDEDDAGDAPFGGRSKQRQRALLPATTPLGMTLAALEGGGQQLVQQGRADGGSFGRGYGLDADDDDDADERPPPPTRVDALVAVAEVSLFVLRDAVVLADVWEEVRGLGSAVTTRQQLRIALHRDGLGVAASPRCPVVGGPQRDALVLWPRRRDAVLQGVPSAAYYLCAESTGALWPLLDLLLRREGGAG
jgi:hypothetical protein